MAELDIGIKATNETSPGVAAAKRALSGVTSVAANLGKVAAGAGLAVGAAAVKVGVEALNISRDTQTAARSIEAQLNVTREEAERLANVGRDVFGNNWADSVGEAADAVRLLHQEVEGVTGQEQNLTQLAFSISDTFDQPLEDVIKAVGVLTEEFEGLDPTEAFDLITAGFQNGLDSSGDFLDSIGEYSNLFGTAGFDADEFFSTLSSGLEGGVLGTDKIADAFKEFQIRLLEGSDDMVSSLAEVGLNTDELYAGISDGSVTARDAFNSVLEHISGLEDPLVRARLETELFGTQAEDLGVGFTENLYLAGQGFDDVAGKTEALGVKYDTFGDLATGIWRQILVALSPLTDELLAMGTEYLPIVGDWITANMPAIIQWFKDAYTGAQPFITAFSSGAETIFDWLQDLWAWLQNNEVAMKAVFAAIGVAIVVALGPVAAATVAITALIAAVGLIKDNWDTIEGYFTDLWENTGAKFTEGWRNIADNTLQPLIDAVGAVTLAWSGVSQWFADMWDNVGDGFVQAWQQVSDILFPTPSYGEQVKAAWAGIVASIKGTFKDGANSAINILNQLVTAMNTPLRKWNELTFSVPGFSKTIGGGTFLGKQIPSKTFGWSGISISTPDVALIPNIPKLARGGIVREPTIALIGEAGPERVEPLNSANSGGSNVYMTVMGTIKTDQELRKYILSIVNEGKREGAAA